MLTNLTVTYSRLMTVTCQGAPMQTIGSRSSYRSIREAIPEQSTVRITAIIPDEAGVAIAGSSLTTLTLTLWDVTGGADAIVNSVNAVDIKNVGRGNVSAVGLLTLTLTLADTAILVATHVYEERMVTLSWTWASGAKAGHHEVLLLIRNLQKVG